MKNYFLFLFFYCIGLNAQIINFPDANFKAKLLQADVNNQIAGSVKIDSNNNGEIEVAEALLVNRLHIELSNITSIIGLNYFTNLNLLDCRNNSIVDIDLSQNTNLITLDCSGNQLNNINVQQNTLLETFICSHNLLSVLDLSQNVMLVNLHCSNNLLVTLNINQANNLINLYCDNNLLTNLNVEQSPNLINLYCEFNQLLNIFLKNGSNENFVFFGNANLEYICADEGQLLDIQNKIALYGYTNPNCQVNSYCTFTPGGTFYTIQGNNKFDENNNGCDVADNALPNLKYAISNGSITESLISNTSGNYSIPVQAGTHTITPVLETPAYFTVSPASSTVTFPTQSSPFTQNFCVTANGVHPDLEVALLPIIVARPGFDATYKVVYKNKGNTTQSGSVNFAFNDAVLDLVTSNPVVTNQTINNLSWDFTNLLPFETREILVTLNVNSPMESPAVNGGDILNYTATIISGNTDEMPSDNSFTLNQTIVNSYDPNDKTCLEGATIPPSKVGDYVHYMIRFENNGTANAQNIVVKDMIDLAKFDINSLVPLKGSHSFVTNISAGNKVEFIFENINLPFDDANNDGYVAFKIKTNPTLVNGDTFSNTASIYFDYNFPIVTNTATTTIAALSRQDFEFSNYFNVYPNPVQNVLNITAKETIEISSINIYNTLGQLVLVIPNAQNIKAVDVSSLTSGNYFIKINSDKGTSNSKFIKQ